MLKIKLLHEPGSQDVMCPVFHCDHCGREISKNGLYHWQEKEGALVDGELRVYHKDPCSHLVQEEEEAQGLSFPWGEMDWLLGYLANNTGVAWKRLAQHCPTDQLLQLKQSASEQMKSRKQENL